MVWWGTPCFRATPSPQLPTHLLTCLCTLQEAAHRRKLEAKRKQLAVEEEVRVLLMSVWRQGLVEFRDERGQTGCTSCLL